MGTILLLKNSAAAVILNNFYGTADYFLVISVLVSVIVKVVRSDKNNTLILISLLQPITLNIAAEIKGNEVNFNFFCI